MVIYAAIMVGSMIAFTLIIEGLQHLAARIKNKRQEKRLQNG